MVEKYILQNSGSKEDAADVFQDAFCLLLQKASAPDFTLTAKPETLLYGISRNLWLKALNRKKSSADLPHELEDDTEDMETAGAVELGQLKKLRICLDQIGEPCQTILVRYYYDDYSMKEIAETLHYSNAHHAKNQKYKCVIRLKKLLTAMR